MTADHSSTPLSEAESIVRRTAQQFDADIAMLFIVAADQLVLQGGHISLSGKLLDSGDDGFRLAYALDWNQSDLTGGLTAKTAVTAKACTKLSLDELLADPAHRGLWDERVYPVGIEDSQNGFGCLHAVPLLRNSSSAPRDSVIGVFKIERRSGKDVFDSAELAAFDVVARHLSAVLRDHSERSAETFFPMLQVRVDSLQPTVPDEHTQPRRLEAMDRTATGLRGLGLPTEYTETALTNIASWLLGENFLAYRPQLEWMIDSENWPLLLDSFYRVIPFGTGGRRGPVGIGTNRFNPFTLASSVQGHVNYLRKVSDVVDLSVVVVYDVRQYSDLRGVYCPELENPLLGMTSRDFARIAAGVYAANGVTVHTLSPEDARFVSTPELSFAIRMLGASAGLNISASHNHPDDNGGKFYNHQGGQEIPPQDERMAEHVERAANLVSLDFENAIQARRIEWIAPEIHEAYIAMNRRQSLSTSRSARVVFTPLHGTGDSTVGETLRALDFEVLSVPEEQEPDGAFPAVPYRAPNPEVPESMRRGETVAAAHEADLVMACDPDADRIGCSVRVRDGTYRFLSGNEIAVLVAHYKLDRLRKHGRLPSRPIVIKTEVTTEMLRPVTEAFGGRLIGDLLVGFKYHGAVLNELETAGAYRGEAGALSDFVIAVEESHGILVTPEVRDKDAAGAAVLLAELASGMRDEGRTVGDYLDDLYRRYGYYATHLSSMVMDGAKGVDAIQKIQESLRKTPPERIGDLRVTQVVDHLDEGGAHGPWKSETDRTSRNVLVFRLENGARIIIRPSGTEPKNKTYVELPRAPLGTDASEADLREERSRAIEQAEAIADDFSQHSLSIVGVDLPRYALHISGLVELGRRIDFVENFLPELEQRTHAVASGDGSSEAIGAWVDERLARYGPDARGLVRRAVHEFVDETRSKIDTTAERAAALEVILGIFG